MGGLGSIEVVLRDQKLRTARGERMGWMYEELARTRRAQTGSSKRWHSVLGAVGAVPAIVATLTAMPG